VRLALAALAALALAFAGAACLPRPKSTPPVLVYDFGLAAETDAADPPAVVAVPLVVRRPEAPLWVDSPSIDYRLAYEDPAEIRSYAYSTWVSSPVALLGNLLRQRVALASAGGMTAGADTGRDEGFVLESTVEEFSQVFDSRESSRVVLRALAALVRQSDRQVVARRTFAIERPAPTPDARGAVRGFGEAGRELADRVVAWVAETTRAQAGTPPKEADGP
jgi:cholesterol transport system auxiliary component